MSGEIPTKIKNVLFVVTHPALSLRAKIRQTAVAIEHQAPPHTSTFEEFTELPLADAARAMMATKERGRVPRSAWSKKDQQRMDEGKKPLGHPEHPNI